jgi:hypothetical protein
MSHISQLKLFRISIQIEVKQLIENCVQHTNKKGFFVGDPSFIPYVTI